jgi:acetyl-CoA carboxylase biotin carboxyl carrier protein
MTSFKKDAVIELLKIFAESTLDEMHLEMSELKLIAKKDATHGAIQESDMASQEPTEVPAREKPPEIPPVQDSDISPAIPREGPPQSEEPIVQPEAEGFTPIKSPMLGTFYRAPKPGAPPFVQVGQAVSEDDTVCIIEVMKLFNTVKAGVRGRIVKVCMEDAQMVEFQQTLFLVGEFTEEALRKEQAQ